MSDLTITIDGVTFTKTIDGVTFDTYKGVRLFERGFWKITGPNALVTPLPYFKLSIAIQQCTPIIIDNKTLLDEWVDHADFLQFSKSPPDRLTVKIRKNGICKDLTLKYINAFMIECHIEGRCVCECKNISNTWVNLNHVNPPQGTKLLSSQIKNSFRLINFLLINPSDTEKIDEWVTYHNLKWTPIDPVNYDFTNMKKPTGNTFITASINHELRDKMVIAMLRAGTTGDLYFIADEILKGRETQSNDLTPLLQAVADRTHVGDFVTISRDAYDNVCAALAKAGVK